MIRLDGVPPVSVLRGGRVVVVVPVTVMLASCVKGVPSTVAVAVTVALVFGSVTVVCATPLGLVIAIDGETAPLLVVLSVNVTPTPGTGISQLSLAQSLPVVRWSRQYP